MNYNHALVTGGAGFIGSHIVEKLLDKGIEVTVLDNLSVGKKENIPVDAKFVEGDIQDINLLKELTNQCDCIFHQAAKVSIRASMNECYEDAQTNLMGTLNILRACEDAKVKKFVFASSMAVYADSPKVEPIDENYKKGPLSPYGIAKLASEQYIHLMCRKNNIKSVVLRYFNTFGPRQTLTPYVGVITIFINKLLNGESPVIFGEGNQLRDFVYVGDIASANILALEKDITEVTLNIGTGEPTSVNRIAEILIQKINPGIKAIRGPEYPEELKISFADITKAKQYIGYKPEFDLEDKIKEIIDYIKNNS